MNEKAPDWPSDRCVHALFADQALRTPDAVAVVYGAEPLTYRELDQRANQLAHHIRCLGVDRGQLVGICLERGEAMVVAMLAILKAGGAYVPLDPTYPAPRLRFMLEDAGAPVVLTASGLAEVVGETTAQLVCLDREGEAIAAMPDEPPSSDATAADLAYVMYTSGSTG